MDNSGFPPRADHAREGALASRHRTGDAGPLPASKNSSRAAAGGDEVPRDGEGGGSLPVAAGSRASAAAAAFHFDLDLRSSETTR